jgi:aminopeptidase N
MLRISIGSSKNLKYFIRTYMSAVPDDLTRALQMAADEDQSITNYQYDVKTVFDSWHLKAGAPVLHVSIDPDDKKLVIKQVRFVSVKRYFFAILINVHKIFKL